MTILIRALAVRGQKSVEPEFKVTTLKAGSNETTPKDCQNLRFRSRRRLPHLLSARNSRRANSVARFFMVLLKASRWVVDNGYPAKTLETRLYRDDFFLCRRA